MNSKNFFLIFFSLWLTVGSAQLKPLLMDSMFQNVSTIDIDEVVPTDFENNWVSFKDQYSSAQSVTRQSDGASLLQLNLRLNSIKVDDNYVTTQLSHTLNAGEKYRLTIDVAKDKFSGYSIKELIIYFSASHPIHRQLKYNDFQNSITVLSLDSITNGKSVKTLEVEYTANGGEKYISIGSINQSFKFFETTKYNLMLADETYKSGIIGAVYYLTNLKIYPIGKKDEVLLHQNLMNVQNVNNAYRNLILNGGFECKITDKLQTTTFNNPGELVGPFVRSVNEMSVRIIQSDSNDYRSIYQKEALPYMGNSFGSFKAIATNEHHKYQKAVFVEKGQDYNTTYFYEDVPPKDTMPIYKYGAVMSFALAQALQKDSMYSFSFMMKLAKKSAYGLDFLGFHVLKDFPANEKNKLWTRLPDQVIPIKDLTEKNNWVEKQILFKAKGGEKFIAIGSVYPNNQIVTNQNFEPEVSATCGPNDGYCYNRKVYFADSLFANYYIDNVVCLPNAQFQTNPSAVYGDETNQVEFVFTPILKGNNAKEKRFGDVQQALVTILDILRTTDAICIADINKRDQVTLSPYEVINKKKIIRKIYRPKLQRKIKGGAENDKMILFSGESVKGFKNHLIIIIDETFDFTNWEYKLTKFDKNGGYLTFINVANLEKSTSVNEKLVQYTNAVVIHPEREDVSKALLKRITLKM